MTLSRLIVFAFFFVFLSLSSKGDIETTLRHTSVFEVESVLRLAIESKLPVRDATLYLNDTAPEGEQLALRLSRGELGPDQRIQFLIPDDWVGREAYISSSVFESGQRLQVSGPFPQQSEWWQEQEGQGRQQAIMFLLALAFQVGTMLLPGILLWLVFFRILPEAGPFFIPWVFALTALAALAVFYLAALSPLFSRILVLAIWVLSVTILFHPDYLSRLKKYLFLLPNFLPILVWGLACFVAAAWGFFHDWRLSYAEIAQHRFAFSLTPDNYLPELLARVHAFDLHRTPFFTDWLSSDRPPLQSGFILLQSPFYFLGWDTGALQTGLVVQVWVLPLALVAFRYLGLGIVPSMGATLVILFSSVFLINSVFVWPKLLPAAFLFALVGVAFGSRRRFRESLLVFPASLVGLLAVLAMLSHGGSLFALLALFLLFPVFARFPGLRPTAIALIVTFALYSPWFGYQKFMDPPGDRIAKWHLAGVTHESEESLITELKNTYSNLSLNDWFWIRGENLKKIMGDYWKIPQWIEEGIGGLIWNLQTQSFLSQLFALGLLNLGWFAALSPITWKVGDEPTQRRIGIRITALLCILAGLLSTFIWAGLIHIPGRTILHHGPYFQPLALSVGLFLATWCFHPRLGALLLVGHIGVSLIVWLLPPLIWSLGRSDVFGYPPILWPLAAVGILSLLTLFSICLIEAKRDLGGP